MVSGTKVNKTLNKNLHVQVSTLVWRHVGVVNESQQCHMTYARASLCCCSSSPPALPPILQGIGRHLCLNPFVEYALQLFLELRAQGCFFLKRLVLSKSAITLSILTRLL